MARTAAVQTSEPKVSKIDPNETKAQKFLRLGKPRVEHALKAITLIGNLAGSGYEYSPDQVSAIRRSLNETIESTMLKFELKKNGAKPTFDF